MFDNKTIGERFAALRKTKKDIHGKDMPIQQLAKELANEDYIRDYKSDVIRQEIGKVESKGKFPQLFLIEGYSKYFHVTSDYLLGLRNTKPIDENIAMISKKTGLTDTAIETLSSWYEYQKNMKRDYQEQIYFPIEVLNILLSDSNAEWLLRGIQDLLKSNYKIPAYHNGEREVANINKKYSKCSIPKCIVPDSDYDVIKGHDGFNDLYLLTLVQDKTKTWDNTQIALDDDFFEAVAMKTIEKYLRKIRDNYLEEKESNASGTT